MNRAKKRARRVSMALLAAAGAAVSLASTATTTHAATVTWTGTIFDPLSGGAPGGYTSGNPAYQNLLLYNWNSAASGTPIQNWKDTGGNPTNFTIGDSVIFDGTSTGRNIVLPDSGMNPTAMNFRSANSSQVFTFFRSAGSGFPGDFQKAPDDLGTTADLSANAPWSSAYTTTLTLESSFQGRVILRSRPGNATNATGSATFILGGILEINDAGALPAGSSNTNQPNVTLAGGELDININTVGNIQPASAQISGTLSVTDNSVLANLAINSSRVWGGTSAGTLNISAGKTLTIKSINGQRAEIGAQMTGAANLGTLKLADVGANVTQLAIDRTNVSMPTGLLDIGVGQSEVMNVLGTNPNITFGGLIGGVNTKLSGSNQSGINSTYTLGTKAADVPNGYTGTATFDGIIRDGTGGNVSVAKQGSGTTQVLTGINSYTGSTSSNNGTLVLAGTNGSAQSTSAIVVNTGGTIKLDNTTNNDDRIALGTPIQLQGGTFEFAGNVVVGTNEAAGQLQVKSLASTVKASEVGGSFTNPAKITFSSLSRDSGFVDFVLDTNVNLSFGTAPTVVNNILDGAYATANGTDWATVTGGDNHVIAYTGYITDIAQPDPANWHANDNIRITGSSATIATNVTINSLKLDGGATLTINSGQTLNLGTGGILAGSSGSASSSTFAGSLGTLTATSQIGAMVANSGSVMAINVPLANSTNPLGIAKNGAGTMVLGATGTATGNSLIGQGTLTTLATNALPSGSVTVDGNANFNLGNTSSGFFGQTVTSLNLKSGTINGLTTSLTVTGTAPDSITVSSGTINTKLLGASAGLTKTGGGTVTLGTANSYSGGTYVRGGTLTANANGAFPSSGALEVTGGATLALGTNSSSTGTLKVGDATTVPASPTLGNITGSGTLTIGSTADVQSGQIDPIIDDGAGTFGLTKNASNLSSNSQASEMILTNTGSSYDGVTTINVGSLNIKKIGNGLSVSSIGKSPKAASNLVLNGGKLRYTGNVAANGVTDRSFTVNADSILDGSGGANPLQFTDTTGAVVFTNGGHVLQLDGSSSTAANLIALQIPDGSSLTSITKKSSSTWSLTNTGNSFSGSVQLFGGILDQAIINNGSTLGPLGQSSNAANNLVFQIGNNVSNTSGTLKYSGGGQITDRLFNLNGGGTVDASGAGPIDFNNTGAMGGGGTLLTLTGTNTGDNTLRAQVGGSNPVNTAITKDGAGTWVLTNTGNSYDSATTIKAGILKVSFLDIGGQPSNIGAADNTAASLVLNSGTLLYTGGAVTTDRLFTLNSFVASSPGTPITSTIDSSGSGAMNFNNPGDVGTPTSIPAGVDRTAFKYVAQTLLLTGSYVGNTNTLAANIGNTLITDGSAKTAYATSVSKAGPGSWRLTGVQNYTGSTTVSAGTLAVASSIPRTGSVSITGGKLELEHSGSRIIKTGALSIVGGKLDLHDNRLITTTGAGTPTAGTYSGVQGMVQTGRASGAWSGNGLITSEADAVGGTAVTTIGVATGNQALGITGTTTGTWGGQTVTPTSVLAMYTYAGDANLSGHIDGDDYFRIDAGFPAGNGYANGDFNYDGKINADDYWLIDANYSRQFGVALAPLPDGLSAGGVSAVPEPASLTTIALAGVGLLARRRRRR